MHLTIRMLEDGWWVITTGPAPEKLYGPFDFEFEAELSLQIHQPEKIA